MFRKLSKRQILNCSFSGLIFLFLFNLASTSVLSETLRVGTKPFKPFAFVREGEYIGFSIELWQEIAKELELDYELYGETTVTDLLESVATENTDVAIAGITVTSEREKKRRLLPLLNGRVMVLR